MEGKNLSLIPHAARGASQPPRPSDYGDNNATTIDAKNNNEFKKNVIKGVREKFWVNSKIKCVWIGNKNNLR